MLIGFNTPPRAVFYQVQTPTSTTNKPFVLRLSLFKAVGGRNEANCSCLISVIDISYTFLPGQSRICVLSGQNNDETTHGTSLSEIPQRESVRERERERERERGLFAEGCCTKDRFINV